METENSLINSLKDRIDELERSNQILDASVDSCRKEFNVCRNVEYDLKNKFYTNLGYKSDYRHLVDETGKTHYVTVWLKENDDKNGSTNVGQSSSDGSSFGDFIDEYWKLGLAILIIIALVGVIIGLSFEIQSKDKQLNGSSSGGSSDEEEK